MGLSPEDTSRKAWQLGVASAVMVALGYPGEVQNGPGARLQWWSFAVIPFLFVVFNLAIGLEGATQKLPPSIASLVRTARWLTIISWSAGKSAERGRILPIGGSALVSRCLSQ